MLYCARCMRLCEGPLCPVCRKSDLRQPEAKDVCFLTERGQIWGSILEDNLNDCRIPFLKKEVLGAGLAIKVGPMLDRSRFYVRYPQLDSARAVMEDLFAVPPEGTEENEE